MRFDRGEHRFRATVVDGDETPGVGERVQHRVDAADVVEEQEGDGPECGAGRLEFLQDQVKVVDDGLALAGRAGGEENETGMSPFPECGVVFVIGPARKKANLCRIAVIGGDGHFCLGDVGEAIELGGGVSGERDDNAAEAG